MAIPGGIGLKYGGPNWAECIPWDALAEGYYQDLEERQDRPTRDVRHGCYPEVTEANKEALKRLKA